MTNPLDLRSSKILITGASGFIGGRLAEYLTLHYAADVRCLVRSYGKAVRLARLPVTLLSGDLLNADAVQAAARECDIVFHCAFGASGTPEERRRATVDGAQNILEAAAAAGAQRFVHVSTIAVHGPDPSARITEDTPLQYSNDVYADAKIDAEKLVNAYGATRGLPVTIVRPTIVYGPRAGGWTVAQIQQMRSGKQTLIDSGAGIANHVYVDDVVQLLLLAAVRPEAVGQAFIASHGTGVTWRDFFQHYADLLGVELRNLSLETIAQQRKRMAQLRRPHNMGLSFAASPHAQSIVREMPVLGGLVQAAHHRIPGNVKESLLAHAAAMRETKLNPPALPRQWMIDLFCAKGLCQIDKAQRLLGYRPQFDLADGMQRTQFWLRDVGLV